MENNIDTIIGYSVSLKGNLKNKGSIQVNGNVEGEVRSEEHVNIGETAKVVGPVIAKTVEVSGEVKGLIEVSEQLEIKPTGKVFGDINAKSLIILQGALFVGKCTMPNDKSNLTEKEVKSPETSEPLPEVKDDESGEEKSANRDPLGFFKK